jgi:hypothetical protein
LNVLKPNLRKVGVTIETYRDDVNRLLRLRKTNSADGIHDGTGDIKKISSGKKSSNINRADDTDGIDGISYVYGSGNSLDIPIDE